MNKITDKKAADRIILLFMLTYLISYVTRINYGAVIAEIIDAEHIKKSIASLALTGSAVTYGAGQLISGYMGDRIQPKTLVFSGLAATTAANLLLPLCGNAYQMIRAANRTFRNRCAHHLNFRIRRMFHAFN